ncbi:hypothetical protein Plo01_58090 [Planobispora longispora]|uniref:Uncharacterized protein n=1 Tax=Planobispora longispora TaxID=28887 RepID=A0A8J3RQG5_9ACTN|nr:hypothetical protein GCM10020093_046270 [Planobispora longispora]GIH79380.1 hypothetical protein Plo01_58090 [Planobispora longispora]
MATNRLASKVATVARTARDLDFTMCSDSSDSTDRVAPDRALRPAGHLRVPQQGATADLHAAPDRVVHNPVVLG